MSRFQKQFNKLVAENSKLPDGHPDKGAIISVRCNSDKAFRKIRIKAKELGIFGFTHNRCEVYFTERAYSLSIGLYGTVYRHWLESGQTEQMR